MISVTGTQKVYNVTTEISLDELIKAVYIASGLTAVCSTNLDCYWSREPDKLIEMENISYHGSPYYRPTGRKITDPNKIKLFDLIHEIIPLLHKVEEEQENPR